ncbi:MAG TPA: hypothetical protein VH092_13295 [Urbifossiella sp.]|jgi:hypothetical protein|nr:hypothetical protein [Urbifossiella sp.]
MPADAATWDATPDPLVLLDLLFPTRGHDSTPVQCRESKLYLSACARRAWDRLPGVCRAVAWVGERMAARSRVSSAERDAARAAAEELFHGRGSPEAVRVAGRLLRDALLPVPAGPEAPAADWPVLAYLVYAPFAAAAPVYSWVPAPLHSADLVRDVFGNPFCRAEVAPEWRTEAVVTLARGMTARGEFAPMPVLADALEDAGCADDLVLDHCRGPGPHARGCWVLESVLRRRSPSAGRAIQTGA